MVQDPFRVSTVEILVLDASLFSYSRFVRSRFAEYGTEILWKGP